VRDGQTSPHRPRLVVSRSTCPPLSSPPHANSSVLGPAVIKHTRPNKNTKSLVTQHNCVGSGSPDGWDQIPRWAGGWACTSHPGVLGSRGTKENRAQPVLKYRVPHGSHSFIVGITVINGTSLQSPKSPKSPLRERERERQRARAREKERTLLATIHNGEREKERALLGNSIKGGLGRTDSASCYGLLPHRAFTKRTGCRHKLRSTSPLQ